jgi:hypothetical protein
MARFEVAGCTRLSRAGRFEVQRIQEARIRLVNSGTLSETHLMARIALAFSTSLLLLAACQSMTTAPDYERWALLENPFESTTGGGVMIDGYDPVVGQLGGRKVCTTDYSVRVPGRPVLYSEIVFEAREVQGGILCTQGKWRAKDNSAAGTTPFEVFIKDGVRRRSP